MHKNSAEKCPVCSRVAQQKYRPFCSDPCRLVDLNRWLSGSYAVPTEESPDFGEKQPDDI